MTADAPSGLAPRFRPRTESLLVLGLSLGQSAIYSVLSIIRSLTQGPLNQQTTTINNSVTPERPWLDLAYQVAGIAFPLVPVGVALYLLWQTGDRARIGFDLRRPGFDLGRGFFAAAILRAAAQLRRSSMERSRRPAYSTQTTVGIR